MSPGAVTGTTANDGTLTLASLPIGGYTLTAQRSGYTSTTTAVGVSTAGPTSVALALATNATSSDGMAIVLKSNLLAGYGAPVQLAAKVTAPDADAAGLIYSWKQTGGTPAVLTGTNTSTLSFTTLTLASTKLEGNLNLTLNGVTGAFVPGRFGPMGISPDETGNYGFQLTVTDPAGHTATASATVEATSPSPGLADVPIGLPMFLQGDNISDAGAITLADGGWAQTSWSWALTTPTGSAATLANATTQFPSFTPDVPGSVHDHRAGVAGKTLTIYAAAFDGVSGGATPDTGNDYAVQGCTACHNGPTTIPYAGTPNAPPDMFTPWSKTAHAGAFSSYIDGQIGQEFGQDCLQCHTLGTNAAKTVPNDGFDDVATKDGWSFPSPLASGDNATLVSTKPDLAQLANVQCESCHGPQKAGSHPLGTNARISYSNEVCASCHGDQTFHTKGAQWKQSPHADLALAMQEGVSSNCGRCHSSQGFSQYSQQLAASTGQYASGSAGYLTSDGNPATFSGTTQTNVATTASLTNLGLTTATIEPQTCQGCHDPHDTAGNPFQLRLYDTLPAGLPDGQGAISGVGAGAVCMACHNTRNGETDDSTAATLSTTAGVSRAGHDGPQTDMLFGVNAYFVPTRNPSPHLAVTDTCVGCHEELPNAQEVAAGQTTNHSFIADLSICSSCHGSSGVNGAALQGAVQSQMLALDNLIFTKVAKAFATAVTTNTSYAIQALDTATGNYLCAAAGTGTPAFTFTAAPVAATITEPQPVQKWRTLGTGLWWAPPQALSGTPECTSSGALVAGVTYNGTATLQVAPGSATSGGVVVISVASVLARAMSNESLLHNDETWGIHNLPFTQLVITNTTTQLNAL